MATTRRAFISHFAAGVALLVQSGCGWHPLYGSAADGGPGPAPKGLAEVDIALIPERSGQLLRLALQERFERAGLTAASRYDLLVAFAISSDGDAIRQDNTTTHVRIVGTADWKLVAQNPQRSTLTSGTARGVDGYDIIDQQYFAADLENETIQRRVAELVADRITEQLAVFFNKRAATG